MRVFPQLLSAAARLVYRGYAVILSVSVVLTLVSAWLVATQLGIINNTNALIRQDSPVMKNYMAYKEEFQYEEDIVAVIRSQNPDRNRQVADILGQRLSTIEPGVKQVTAKFDFSRMQPRFLFFLSDDELKKIDGEIQEYAGALQQQGVKFDLNSMLDQANSQFDEKNLRKKSSWQEFIPFIDRFAAMLNQLADQVEGKAKPPKVKVAKGEAGQDAELGFQDFQKQLTDNEYASFDEGKMILVTLTPTSIALDAKDPYGELVAKVRDVVNQVAAENKDVTIGLTGEPVLLDSELKTTEKDAIHSSLVAFLVIAILFAFSYRERSRPALALVVLIMTTLWSVGFAALSIGHLNLISQAFVAMVIGLGVDFGIQIMGRYEEELARGRSVEDALQAALTTTGLAVVTGGLTTAAAFYTMCFNDFIGLQEFGIVAGTGILICVSANLLVLPSFYVWRDRRRAAAELQKQAELSQWAGSPDSGRWLVRYPKTVLAIGAVITVLAVLGTQRVTFDYNLLNLQSQDDEALLEARRLMNDADNSIIYAAVVADNLDQAKELVPKLQALPSVQAVHTVTEMLPENQDAKLPIIRQIVGRLASVKVTDDVSDKVDVEKARRDIAELLQKSREAEAQAKKYAGISKMARDATDTFRKLIPPLERAQKAIGGLSQQELTDRLTRYQRDVFGSMQHGLFWLKNHATDRGIEMEDIPASLRDRFVSPNGKIMIQVYPKEDIWQREPNIRFVEEVRSISPDATGTPVQNLEYIELLRTSYVQASFLAFIAILVFIVVHFRTLSAVLLTLFPLGLAILWTAGLMGWLGLPFNPANIITLPLVIGIGVAYGIYTVDRFKEQGRVDLFATSTGKAIFLSAMTAGIGFGSLMVSHHHGLFTLGMMMAIGVGMCLITSLGLLPQILVFLEKKRS